MRIYQQIVLVTTLAVATGSGLIQSTPAALATHFNIEIDQHINQASICDKGASCGNTAQNGASVNIPQVDTTNTNVKIHQHIDQANLCSGEGTHCSNSGTNAVTLGASKELG